MLQCRQPHPILPSPTSTQHPRGSLCLPCHDMPDPATAASSGTDRHEDSYSSKWQLTVSNCFNCKTTITTHACGLLGQVVPDSAYIEAGFRARDTWGKHLKRIMMRRLPKQGDAATLCGLRLLHLQSSRPHEAWHICDLCCCVLCDRPGVRLCPSAGPFTPQYMILRFTAIHACTESCEVKI